MTLFLTLYMFAATKYQVILNWTATPTPKAKTYYVYRSLAGKPFTRIISTSNTSYTDSNATAGAACYYVTTYYKTESAPTAIKCVTLP
jgi:fibronectin type 3 domain-containing protein